MKTIKAAGDFIVLQMIRESESKIIMPDQVKPNLVRNIVVSVGKQVTRCKPGDNVLVFPAQAAISIDLPDVEPDLVFVKEEFIVGAFVEVNGPMIGEGQVIG